MVRAQVCAAVLLLAVQAGGDYFTCNDLDIWDSDTGESCISCLQWCYGFVDKDSPNGGPLCLYLYGPETYNVCDYTVYIWVGTSINEYCFMVQPEVTQVSWCLESERFDWEQLAWAWLYIHVPCLNPWTKVVQAVWSEYCPYCPDCTE